MIRERIIRQAIHLFRQYGIKSVNMNMIAEEAGMSKKTIYEQFENKDEIVKECIVYEVTQARETFDRREREAENAIEAIANISQDISQYTSYYCPAFYKNLIRYTDTQAVLRAFRFEVERMYTRLFKRGVVEGVFRAETEYEIVAKIFTGQFEQVKQEYQFSMSQTLLRGISTEKGIQMLERIGTATGMKKQFNVY